MCREFYPSVIIKKIIIFFSKPFPQISSKLDFWVELNHLCLFLLLIRHLYHNIKNNLNNEVDVLGRTSLHRRWWSVDVCAHPPSHLCFSQPSFSQHFSQSLLKKKQMLIRATELVFPPQNGVGTQTVKSSHTFKHLQTFWSKSRCGSNNYREKLQLYFSVFIFYFSFHPVPLLLHSHLYFYLFLPHVPPSCHFSVPRVPPPPPFYVLHVLRASRHHFCFKRSWKVKGQVVLLC